MINGSVDSTSKMRPAAPVARAGLRDQLAGEAEGQDQHDDVEVEGDEVADLEVAVEHLMAAVPEDRGERERGEEVERGQEAGPQASRDERAFEHRVGFRVEAVDLELLGAEALDRVDAGHRLLDDGGQVAELLLLLQADGRQPSREARGHTLSNGSAPSASNASTGLESTITMITPMRMKRLDRLIGPSDSHWLIW